MTLKELLNIDFSSLPFRRLRFYTILLYHSRYYAADDGNSYRVDIDKISKDISIDFFCEDEIQPYKETQKGNKRYFIRKTLVDKFEVSVTIKECNEKFHISQLPKRKCKPFITLFIVIVAIAMILLVWYIKKYNVTILSIRNIMLNVCNFIKFI